MDKSPQGRLSYLSHAIKGIIGRFDCILRQRNGRGAPSCSRPYLLPPLGLPFHSVSSLPSVLASFEQPLHFELSDG